MSLQAIVDENKQVIFDDNGNIFVYNSLNNCATYMEDTAENRNLLNMPLQNDEMIGQGSNANCSADKTKDDGPRWTHDKILLLFSLYQDNINLFKFAKKTNRSIWNGIAEYKNKGTGNGAISWPYFDLFDSLFGKSADTVPIATASNTDGYLSRCSTPGTPDTSVVRCECLYVSHLEKLQQENTDVAARYLDKIRIIGSVDPYTLSSADLDYGVDAIPPISSIDIVSYLVLTHSFYTKNQIKVW
ncbi:hypothetical protein FQA39_LY18501 [Lamprigera yunnana]|nr:hypothetical protein FQA39_LY18501 [Lamprigera yunnana]